MTQQSLQQPRVRGSIQNQETGEIFRFQFNPPQFSERFAANYARHVVPGLGHQILQYISSNNNVIELQLYFTRMLVDQSQEEEWPLLDSKRFLQSLLVPNKNANGGWQAPPLLLFVWPNMVRLYCVATSLEFLHSRFDQRLKTMQGTANLSLEEIRTVPVFSDDIRSGGSSTTRGSSNIQAAPRQTTHNSNSLTQRDNGATSFGNLR